MHMQLESQEGESLWAPGTIPNPGEEPLRPEAPGRAGLRCSGGTSAMGRPIHLQAPPVGFWGCGGKLLCHLLGH